ncbi:MAG: DUF4831 family protein [Bacteroidaceae bacterium]|nr:DUF4831 family protein [Bacteroidaceae bacterium]
MSAQSKAGGLLPVFSSSQTDVEPFVPGSTLEGVCYFLPRTAFRVTVIAEKTTTRPGDFCKYADRYLRLPNVPTEESVQWSLKSITLEPYGKPDKNKAFNIKLKSKTVAPLVGLSRDGLLLSINCDADESFLPDLPKPEKGAAPENPRTYMTQEIIAAGSTAKMAELCAQEIYDIRDSKNALIRGEADNTPKDGAQLKLMLDQLDKQASVLESLFSGTTQTDTEVFSLYYDPQEETDRDVLFRFSQKLGVLDFENLAGEPVIVSVKALETIPAAVPSEETAKKQAKMEHGVYYNVPVRTKVKITYDGQEYVNMETPMAQFGTVAILSNTLFDKKTNTQVTFFQETGGTKDIME